MSQYIWKNEKYEFLTGWDKPLGYHFLVIDHLDENKREDIPVFSNLDIATGPGMSIEEIKDACKNHGSALPPDVEANLVRDKSPT